ncbi:MAG: hypothetical protein AAF974_13140 [Cyanobacteria bacterium P01_E01_bin.34]
MLSTFRDRHPLGSVVTDLLRVEEGIYVVKAQISVGGIVLGSGMAGSTTVEEAEDAAIQRALRISGITSTSLLGGSAPLGSVALSTTSLDAAPLDRTNGNSISSSFEISSVPHPDTAGPKPSAETTSPPPNGFSSMDDWDTPPSAPEPVTPKPRKTKPAVSKSKPEPEPEIQLEPEIEDLSELIAQTDVELTRIGWGPKEGRRFLKERFRKQSRQQLDEMELREFLQELKQQPTKMLDAAEF